MFYSREQTKDNQTVGLQIIWRTFCTLFSVIRRVEYVPTDASGCASGQLKSSFLARVRTRIR